MLFQFILVPGVELVNFWLDHEGAVRLAGIVFEVILVIVFSLIEPGKLSNFCDDRIIKYA